jgi:CobQ-like glutamine amidotransferase family enzyme
MTIRLLRVLPNLLSLNGSLGNAEVLATRLRWWGFEVQVSDLTEGPAPQTPPDIVVLGHGTSSMVVPAATALEGWRTTFESWSEAGTHWWGAGLGGDLLGRSVRVASTEPAYQGVGLTAVATTLRGVRVSQEVSGVDHQGREVAGYLNDASVREGDTLSPLIPFLPVLNDQWHGHTVSAGEGVHADRIWVSAVSGPFLALNPHIADDILRSVMAHRGEQLPEHTDNHRRVDEAAATARAWIRSRLGSR